MSPKADKYKLRAEASKYKLGTGAKKYKLSALARARIGGWESQIHYETADFINKLKTAWQFFKQKPIHYCLFLVCKYSFT